MFIALLKELKQKTLVGDYEYFARDGASATRILLKGMKS
jgi:hypothetical protein